MWLQLSKVTGTGVVPPDSAIARAIDFVASKSCLLFKSTFLPRQNRTCAELRAGQTVAKRRGG